MCVLVKIWWGDGKREEWKGIYGPGERKAGTDECGDALFEGRIE